MLLQLPPFAILVGFASLLPVALYPFMKRITWWPQAMLGVCFGWGALMGWAATSGSLAAAPLVLYAARVRCGSIGYDTIYAHQDKEDDALVGVGSTALLFGPRTRPIVGLFYAGAAALSAPQCDSPAAGCSPIAASRDLRRTAPGRSQSSTSTIRRCASNCSNRIATPARCFSRALRRRILQA